MRALSSEIRQSLQRVKVRDGAVVDLGLFPDFLIIGPQRTGTTWLHLNLSRHPQVLLPIQKELYYFNHLANPMRHIPEHGRGTSEDLEWYLEFFREPEEVVRRKDAQCRSAVGEPYAPDVRGEATATYAVGVDDAVIQDIFRLNPELKVILMVRDPVERAWSHAKKDLARDAGRDLAEVGEDDFRKFFKLPYQQRCGRYRDILELWQPHVPEGHLLVGHFESIRRDPVALLTQVYGFLGVRSDTRYVPQDAAKKQQQTEPAPIPAKLRAVLEEQFRDAADLPAEGIR